MVKQVFKGRSERMDLLEACARGGPDRGWGPCLAEVGSSYGRNKGDVQFF